MASQVLQGGPAAAMHTPDALNQCCPPLVTRRSSADCAAWLGPTILYTHHICINSQQGLQKTHCRLSSHSIPFRIIAQTRCQQGPPHFLFLYMLPPPSKKQAPKCIATKNTLLRQTLARKQQVSPFHLAFRPHARVLGLRISHQCKLYMPALPPIAAQ